METGEKESIFTLARYVPSRHGELSLVVAPLVQTLMMFCLRPE